MVHGKFIHSFDVYKKTSTKDSLGTPTATYSYHITIFADYTFKSGGEKVINDGSYNYDNIIVTTWPYSFLSESDRLVYSGKTYEIEAIEPMGLNQGLKLHCKHIR